MKTFLLDSKVAQTYNAEGIDVSKRIISFDDLGGTFKVTEDVTLSEQTTLEYFQAMGDYQVAMGDVIPKDTIVTFDITELTEFTGKSEEMKPKSKLFAYVFDLNKLRYRRNTKGMLKQPFYNGEFDEITYWLHYYSFKSMSPFFNSILISE